MKYRLYCRSNQHVADYLSNLDISPDAYNDASQGWFINLYVVLSEDQATFMKLKFPNLTLYPINEV